MDAPTQNIVQFFEEAGEFIKQTLEEDPKNKVLVHCFAGKSRATTITCSFLMTHLRWTLRDSLLHVRACRPIAFPNIGFLVQLKAFESTLLGQCSDVPLKLEKLFGIEVTDDEEITGPADKTVAEKKEDSTGKSVEEIAELKAIKDGEE